MSPSEACSRRSIAAASPTEAELAPQRLLDHLTVAPPLRAARA
jgi:hypothetical protein